jgi:hypothetical protein
MRFLFVFAIFLNMEFVGLYTCNFDIIHLQLRHYTLATSTLYTCNFDIIHLQLLHSRICFTNSVLRWMFCVFVLFSTSPPTVFNAPVPIFICILLISLSVFIEIYASLFQNTRDQIVRKLTCTFYIHYIKEWIQHRNNFTKNRLLCLVSWCLFHSFLYRESLREDFALLLEY